ncbi:MAG TPA: transposase [Gemmataceae bacterium]|nr:transposase [Gemmataceae bacterium]
MAEAAVGVATQGQRRLRGGDGRRAGSLRPARRPEAAAGLFRRGRQAIDRRGAAAVAGATGHGASRGLRVRAERDRQPLHGVCAAGRDAAGRGDPASDQPGLRRAIRRLVEEWYPPAEKIVLVQDNLSTHTPAALYEAFEPAEARRLVEQLEWHYTPKHGSWLNVAEMELSVLARQCLDRRIPDEETLRREVSAWEQKRNAAVVKVDWQFTTADARVKLKRLYPTIELQ